MEAAGLLPQLVLTSAIALAVLIVAGRLQFPALVALIATGVIVGPSGLAIVPHRETVELLAEIGVVLLMFTVGLEFSLVSIRPMLRVALVGGTLQIAFTTAAILGVSVGLVSTARHAMFLGFFVALTSTAILLKELAAHNAVNAPHGRLVVAVALVQDIASILLLALLPLIAGQEGDVAPVWILTRTLLALAGVLAFGWLVLPRLMRLVAASRSREAFSLAVVVASLGTAWFTSQLGVSMALGAFLAGLVLSETEYSHQIFAEIRPLRDILTSLFFVSIGMIIDVDALLPRLPLVLASAVVLSVVKAVASGSALLIAGAPLRSATIAGLLLVPVGEFSFVIGQAAVDIGFLQRDVWQLLLGTSVVTMVVAPWLVSSAPAVGQWVAGRLGRGQAPQPPEHATLRDHVVILGFGVGGRLVARTLRDLSVPYLILELNSATVRAARAEGEPIVFADAANPDAVHTAVIEHARAVVTLLSDQDATMRALRTIRSINPALPVIVRTRYRVEAERLQQAGATLGVAEELEASIEVLAQLLATVDVPGNAIAVLLDNVRRVSTAQRPGRAPTTPLMRIPSAIQESPVATHRIAEGDWAAGRTLGELHLRASTGATVFAIQEGERFITSPTASERLAAGHVLYLMGDESDIMLARALLTDGPRDRQSEI